MLVEAKPLDDNHILGLREQFASAELRGTRLTWDHGFGFGAVSISMTVDLPDGSHVVETISIHDLLQTWAEEVLTEQGVMV